MKKSRKRLKKIAVCILAIALISAMSRMIYADNIPKTTITCVDEAMFDALRTELSAHILSSTDIDRENLTIKIPTDSISQITEVNLENTEISNITGIEKLTSLTKINLSRNDITSIESLRNLNDIIELKLNDNSSLGNSNISDVLNGKTTIKVLNLSNVGLKSIDFVNSLTALQELNAANGSFSDLTPLRTSLIKLNISGNRSVTRIDKILTLTALQELNISNTGITTLEIDENQGIFNLVNLKKLYVGSMNLESLYPIVKTRYIEHHHQDEENNWVGAEVALLNNIEVLDISYNNRNEYNSTSIPSFSELQYFENLKYLYMQGNNITDLSEIYLLKALESVNLENNKIVDLSNIISVESNTDEHGNEYEIIKEYIRAKSIDLSGNEIDDISTIGKLPTLGQITLLDLSANHIYNISSIEGVAGQVNLEDQIINMPIYKKQTGVDQMIFLLPIMQAAKNPNSKLYVNNTQFITSGCSLNTDSTYNTTGLYNVIISKDKTEQDNINVRLRGGIADGSIINFVISEDGTAIDSIMFNDPNFNAAITIEINKVLEEGDYLKAGASLINLNHDILSRITKFDLSNRNISNISGIENFDNLVEVDLSKNAGLSNISTLSYCALIEKLNASETSVGNNYGNAVESLTRLKILLLNNIGMTNINSIITVTNEKIENGEEPILEELDISANNISSIDGVNLITSLNSLTVNGNSLTSIPNLENLYSLERLSAYSNNITKMPKVSNSGMLKYIFMSDNKLDDISELATLTNVIELDLRNNVLTNENLTSLENMKVTKSFKISGNKISDISNLRQIVSNVQELDVSRNKIVDVSIIDSRFQNNGTLTANNQKIIRLLEEKPAGGGNTLNIPLPQIFVASKNSQSLFYTTSAFELTNCTISGNNVVIDFNTLGDNFAMVKITNGKAKDSTFTIVPPIKRVVSFDITGWTCQDVTATISFTNRNTVTVLNNEGSRTHLFTSNGTFTYEFVDEYGIEDSETVIVDWIDKAKPNITGVTNGGVYENNATPVITDDGELESVKLTKRGNATIDFTSGTKITELGDYTLVAKDRAGNEITVAFTIVEPLQKMVLYDITSITNKDVTATITFPNRSNVTITNNRGSNTKTFTTNGEFVIEYTDEYGKSGSEKFKVTWIDKIAPTISGVVNKGVYSEPVKITVTDNSSLASIKITKDDIEQLDFTSGTTVSELGEYKLVAKDRASNETIVTFTISGTSTKKGDINGDGKVTATDVLYLKRIIVGLIERTPELDKVADLNGDGKVTATDLLFLKKIVVGLI